MHYHVEENARKWQNANLWISISVWSHVSNFQTSLSVIGLLYPCCMSGVIHPKKIPVIAYCIKFWTRSSQVHSITSLTYDLHKIYICENHRKHLISVGQTKLSLYIKGLMLLWLFTFPQVPMLDNYQKPYSGHVYGDSSPKPSKYYGGGGGGIKCNGWACNHSTLLSSSKQHGPRMPDFW